DGTEQAPLNQSGTTVRTTIALIAAFLVSSAAGANRALPYDAGLSDLAGVVSDSSGVPQIDAVVKVDRGTFAYAASVTLDTSAHTIFDQTDSMSGNLAVTLSNGAGRKSGSVKVVQDGTGGRTVTFTATGATMVNLGGSVSLTASTYSIIFYEFSTVNSVLVCSYSIA